MLDALRLDSVKNYYFQVILVFKESKDCINIKPIVNFQINPFCQKQVLQNKITSLITWNSNMSQRQTYLFITCQASASELLFTPEHGKFKHVTATDIPLYNLPGRFKNILLDSFFHRNMSRNLGGRHCRSAFPFNRGLLNYRWVERYISWTILGVALGVAKG